MGPIQDQRTYVLSFIDGERDRRYGRSVLCITSHSLSFCPADPLLVRSILHKPDVACVMLKVKCEDPSLAFVP